MMYFRSARVVFAAAVLLGLVAVPAAAQVDLHQFDPHAVNGRPGDVAIADVDLDGLPDLLTANFNSADVAFLGGRGGGAFSTPVRFAVGGSPAGVTPCDLDGDGDLDLAVPDYAFGNDRLAILENDGAGTFTVSYQGVGNRPTAVVCADFDGDGDFDLASSNQDSNDVTVLVNAGDGTFPSTLTFAAQVWPFDLAAADLDGDGRPDLVVANNTSATASVLLNRSTGGVDFAPAASFPVGGRPSGLATADLDGDGDVDVAVANRATSDVSVLLNDGGGDLSARTDYAVGGGSLSVAVGDLDCDGHLDLVATRANNQVTVLRNDDASPGTFVAQRPVPVLDDPRAVTTGDVNGDGRTDVAVASTNGNGVSVLRNADTLTYTYLLQAGERDGFAGSEEQTAPSQRLADEIADRSALPLLRFDQTDSNRWLGHTFRDFPGCVVQGHLELTARAGFGGADNDSLCLELGDGTPADFVWCRRFEDLPESGGSWAEGDEVTFSLDLGDLPPNGAGITSVLERLRDGELHVLVQDDTAVDFLGLELLTCCGDCNASELADLAGAEDDFAGGADPASPSAELVQFVDGVSSFPLVDFDGNASNNWFGHTFEGLPGCVAGATLEVRARATAGGQDNDSICLELTGDAGSPYGWCRRFEDLPESGGSWQSDQTTSFLLDLADLVPNGQGVTDILELLEDGDLDVLVQDDTAVDFLRLEVQPCCEDPPVVGCRADRPWLCVAQDRFEVSVVWRDFVGNSGTGSAVPLTSDTGYFWFFRDTNVELVLKVLDGRPVNGNWWVFYGALSNVPYDVRVRDTLTGATRIYTNPAGLFASAGDTGAFTGDEGGGPAVAAPTASPQGQVHRDVRAFAGLPSDLATAPLAGASSHEGDCDPGPGDEALCLNGDRFRVTVEWTDFVGNSGTGHAVPLTSDTGYFWFFRDTNVELILKVLDGRSLNGHWWVFYGALSNVEYRITVTDTVTGESMSYDNPSGSFASEGDTEAFDE